MDGIPAVASPASSRRAVIWGGLLVALLGSVAILLALHRHASREIREIVRQAALEEGVDPRLALAVVEAESGGNPRAISRARAVGLMQLTLPTASEVAGRPVRERELLEPRLNARLGCRYLRGLIERYRGDLRLALMAYNAGMGNVDRWRSAEPDPARILAGHAFAETRAYVRKVLAQLDADR